jgi:hypothetical protein
VLIGASLLRSNVTVNSAEAFGALNDTTSEGTVPRNSLTLGTTRPLVGVLRLSLTNRIAPFFSVAAIPVRIRD